MIFLSLVQVYHFAGCPYRAFPGQLLEDRVQEGISHPGASPQSAPLHPSAAISEYPEDTSRGDCEGPDLSVIFCSVQLIAIVYIYLQSDEGGGDPRQ